MLIFTGREKPLIQENDPDDKQLISLYDIDPNFRSNTLVPLSYDRFRQYDFIEGKKILEKEGLYYKYGREKDNGIGYKTVILETLHDTLLRLKDS